jgi:hypothetical protein
VRTAAAVSALLRANRNQFQTLDVAWTVSLDLAMLSAAARRWMTQQPPESVVEMRRGRPWGSARPAAAPDAMARFVSDCRLWWRKPACWRDEQRIADRGTIVRIVCEEVSLSFDSALMTFHTNRRMEGRQGRRVRRRIDGRSTPISPHTVASLLPEIPPLNGESVAENCDLYVMTDATHPATGRTGAHVRAEPRPESARHLPYFWSHVDLLEMLVDGTTGVILHSAALIGGERAASCDVTEISFDREIPDEVFHFDPPESATWLYI